MARARIAAPAPIRAVPFNAPPLQDSHRNQPGFYVAACGYDQTRMFPGAVLYFSEDLGQSWHEAARIPVEAVMGHVVTPPSETVDIPPGGGWDTANTIRVRIWNTEASLSSVTIDEMTSGRNRFLVGSEVIGAETVDLVSVDQRTGARTYDLSRLLRGLKDTDDETNGHVADEVVVWLDGPGLEFVPTTFASSESPRRYKAVSAGGVLALAASFEFESTGRTIRPFAVTDIDGTRGGGNDLTITWQRQTRGEMQFLDQGDPLDEDAETYLVEILDAPGGNVLREITTTSPTAEYTAAEQTTDGLTPGDPVDVRVRQTSSRLHHGRPREATV